MKRARASRDTERIVEFLNKEVPRGLKCLLNEQDVYDDTYQETRGTIIELLQRCSRLDELIRQSHRAKSDKELSNIVRDQLRARDAVNEFLSAQNVQFCPLVLLGSGWDREERSTHFAELPAPPSNQQYCIRWGSPTASRTNNKTDGRGLIMEILNMTCAGELNRLRQCICERFFFAQSNKKMVCSDSCRFQKFKQRDQQAFNENRAAYMRARRKNPIVKAKGKLHVKKTRSR